MDKIEWCERFSSGNSDLDAVNRSLLDMINGLIEIRNSEGVDFQSLSSLLSQIQHCALRHFNHEESYMEQIPEEDFSDHKEHHALFRKSLEFFCFGMYSNQDKTFLNDFCEFLKKWFVFHTTNLNEQITELYHEDQIAEIYHENASQFR